VSRFDKKSSFIGVGVCPSLSLIGTYNRSLSWFIVIFIDDYRHPSLSEFIVPEHRDRRCLSGSESYDIGTKSASGMKSTFIGVCSAKLPPGRPNPSR